MKHPYCVATFFPSVLIRQHFDCTLQLCSDPQDNFSLIVRWLAPCGDPFFQTAPFGSVPKVFQRHVYVRAKALLLHRMPTACWRFTWNKQVPFKMQCHPFFNVETGLKITGLPPSMMVLQSGIPMARYFVALTFHNSSSHAYAYSIAAECGHLQRFSAFTILVVPFFFFFFF